jgi:hypothetical protein
MSGTEWKKSSAGRGTFQRIAYGFRVGPAQPTAAARSVALAALPGAGLCFEFELVAGAGIVTASRWFSTAVLPLPANLRQKAT